MQENSAETFIHGKKVLKKELRRKKRQKRKKQKKILMNSMVVVLAVLPLIITYINNIRIIPILIFDVIWFASTLITCIWLMN